MSTFARLEWLDTATSTNDALREAVARDPHGWPHLSALVAAHQTAGRGRTGRSWVTPPGAALTASLLLRPPVPRDRLPWLTLLTGLAVVRALGPADAIGLKWPNDILVDDAGPHLPGWGTARKVGGVLTEMLPADGGPPAVIVGIGVNLSQDAGSLPVPSATSLALANLPTPGAEQLLEAVGRELRALLAPWEVHHGNARGAGLHAAVSRACRTLGRRVRVEHPGGDALEGTAVALDDGGRLVVTDDSARRHVVVAGDVRHVRASPTTEPGPPSGR